MNYTKDEWKALHYDKGGGWIVETRNGMIAHTSEPNAHLIAAAPDIYEAAKELTQHWESDSGLLALILIKLEKAIAKAEGKGGDNSKQERLANG